MNLNSIHYLILAAMFGGLYFLPTIVAFNRQHHNRGTIAIINTVFGWTILGWVIALSMSASGIRKDVA